MTDDGRAAELDDVPSQLMDRIAIYNQLSIAGALAGRRHTAAADIYNEQPQRHVPVLRRRPAGPPHASDCIALTERPQTDGVGPSTAPEVNDRSVHAGAMQYACMQMQRQSW